MRRPEWKQANPHDQSIVLLSNIEGTILNCVDGVFPLFLLESKVMPMIRELRSLQKGYMLGEWGEE
jgi:hypothetical protein